MNIHIKKKSMTQNLNTKNKVIMKRNKQNLLDKEMTKYSIDQNNYVEKATKTIDREYRSKSKKISEIRKGFNKILSNFIEQKNNILNTNYIINKRCRIINNKNKKNISVNLSSYYFDLSHKRNKSPKYNLEINVSNNNLENLNIKDSQSNANNKKIHIRNNILLNNKINKSKSSNNKKKHYIILNSQKKSILHKYNTNIKSTRILEPLTSNSRKRKKIIIGKKLKNENISSNSSLKKTKAIRSRTKENNNINISSSLMSNNDKTNSNDYCLKILDKHYTINNTINITNNNSLLSNFSNNMSNKKNKNENNDNINNNLKSIIRNIFKFLDKENNGFIIINMKQKINDIFNKNKINKDFCKILEKMMKFLIEINKKNSNIDFFEDKIIINENAFIKHMTYIYNYKMNKNEKKIFLSEKNNFEKKIKKDFLEYYLKPKSSFSKSNVEKHFISSFNYLNNINLRENKFIGMDINKYFLHKMKKNLRRKKEKYNSFNDL